MFDRLKRLIALWNDRAQIMELTDRDLAELGVTRDQLLHVAQIPGSVADRMAAMAAIFGVSAEDLQFPRADYIQMLDTCQSCHSLKTLRPRLGRRLGHSSILRLLPQRPRLRRRLNPPFIRVAWGLS